MNAIETITEGPAVIYARFADSFRDPVHGGSTDNDLFTQLFDTAASEAAVSLYEASYVTMARENLFEELVRFFNFFELKRHEDAELPDHLSVELEFMHYLATLEWQAAGQDDAILGLAQAQVDFISRHLVPLVNAVSEGIARGLSDHPELLADLNLFIKDEQKRLGATLYHLKTK